MPPRPAGLGKMLPSISQKTFDLPYSVSFGTLTLTGLLAYMSASRCCHISSDSSTWVSASITAATTILPSGFGHLLDIRPQHQALHFADALGLMGADVFQDWLQLGIVQSLLPAFGDGHLQQHFRGRRAEFQRHEA